MASTADGFATAQPARWLASVIYHFVM